MTILEYDIPQPTSLLQVLRPFIGALMTTKMRADFQAAADAYLRRKILTTSGLDLAGDLVSVLVVQEAEDGGRQRVGRRLVLPYLKNRSAVAPLRRAGFRLTPFKLRNGRAEPATSSTADGWEIDEGTEQ